MAKKSDILIDDKEKELLTRAKDRLRDALESASDQRSAMVADIKFLTPGGQWEDSIKSQRNGEGRPCLEIDRITPFINQLVNEQRQNRPQPNVNPVGDGADTDTAEILQGMIRHIMYMSDGDTAVDTAFESMVRCGVGYMRVTTDYCDETSFDQEVKILRIRDPLSVVLDPSCIDPAGSDAEWGAVCSWMTKDEFKRTYPDSKLTQNEETIWDAVSDTAPEWTEVGGDNSGIAVIEYFEKSYVEETLYQYEGLPNQTVKIQGVEPVKTRKVQRPVVKWYKINSIEILEETVWPGKYIPIIPVYGNEIYSEGKLTQSGLVRTVKDTARLYNYMKSTLAEAVSLAPKTPFVVPKGAVVNPQRWQDVNRRPVAYIEYNAEVNGKPVPPPQPISYSPAIDSISVGSMSAEADIKAITGMFDPIRGISESGQSGVAIRQLQRQGQSVNYHYQDNLSRSLRHLGRVLIDLIAKVYDTPRVVRIVKPDNTEDMVQLRAEFMDKKTGQLKIYDPSVGRYDVTVSVGPSYQTKRQESQAILQSLLQNQALGGLLAAKAPDIIVGLLDFHEAKELQRRLTPAEFADNKQNQIPPEVQQQMQQMQQAIQQYQAAMQQMQQQMGQLQAENQSKQADNEIKMRELGIKAQSEEAKLQLEAQKLQLEQQKIEIERAKLLLEAQQDISDRVRESQPVGEVQIEIEPSENGGEVAETED